HLRRAGERAGADVRLGTGGLGGTAVPGVDPGAERRHSRRPFPGPGGYGENRCPAAYVIAIDRTPIAAVRTIGRTGWTSEICAEIQPVSASARITITKVTAARGGPGIRMMASQGPAGRRSQAGH